MIARMVGLSVIGLSLVTFPVFAMDYVPDRIIIKFDVAIAEKLIHDQSSGIPEVDELLDELKIRKLRRLIPDTGNRNAALKRTFGTAGLISISYSSSVEPEYLSRRLESLPGVIYAHPDYYATLCEIPNDPFYVHQYALPLMQMPEAWNISQGDENIIIGISDTGTDWNHPDLVQNIWINVGEDINGNGIFDNAPESMGGDLDQVDSDGNGYIDDVVGWDFVTAEEVAEGEDGFPPDSDPMDFDGHGTATAGIASAVTDNQTMVAGTGWNCTIMPLKTFYGTPSGNATAVGSDIVESFYYAADNGVRVLSMSFRSVHTELLEEAVQYAHAAGVFLVASAGNETSETAPAPAMYPEVLAVAATQQQDIKASFSNYGPWVGISAPGVDIWTTAFDDSYMADFGGTSASCPYVAGMAGLLISANPTYTPRDIYLRLVGTADEIDSVNPEFRGDLGCGRMNGFRALTENPHPALRLSGISVDDSDGGNGDGLLGPGETASIYFTIRNYWEPASEVIGYLSTADQSISIDSTGIVEFGTVLTDSFVTSQTGAIVIVDPDAEVGYQVEFRLSLESTDGYGEQLYFHVPMAAEMFTDISESWGLSPASGSLTIAFADIDSDGDTDLYRSAWNTDYGLYRNDGSGLVDVTGEWGLPSPGNGQGSAFGDFDNDGDPDLVHGTSSGVALYRNDGPGVGFTDVTSLSGLSVDNPQKFAPLWGDFNMDGYLDLFIAHQQQKNLLFLNNHDGTFSEIGESAGLASDSVSFSASAADFDRDGDLDLFVANYGSPWEGQYNQFYINQGDGTFIESGASLGLAEESLISTGGIWGDFDNDGWLDLYVTNRGYAGQPNRLFRNIRGKGFIRSIDTTVEDPLSSTCASWGDFDGDGLLDLYVCNSQRSSFYRNLGNGIFGNATESTPLIEIATISAWTDIDGDGDEDLFVGSSTGDKLLSNLDDPSTALRIQVRGSIEDWGGSRDALHARLTLSNGTSTITRIVGEGSAMSQGGPYLTFPIFAGDPMIIIEWPRGTIQRVTPGLENQLIIEEERSDIDCAIRTIALPLEISRGEAYVTAEVSIQDNGSVPLQDMGIRLLVENESGLIVYENSVEPVPGSGSLIRFFDVPSPETGLGYTYRFSTETEGDESSWNNELSETVIGAPPHESFELPPVEWTASEQWLWKHENPVYRPYSGNRLMVLPPGGNDTPTLRSPRYPVYAGNVMSLRFMNYYELGDDSLTVHVWQDTVLLGMRMIMGSQDSYTQETLEFPVPTTGDISFDWRCTRTDSTGIDWYYVLDDVELAVIATGTAPDPKPSRFHVAGPWPNPSRGELTWKLNVPERGAGLIEIYDLAGRKIYENRFISESAGSRMITLDLSMLVPGVYVAEFSMMRERIRTTIVHIN